MVRLSVIRTGRLYLPENISGTHFRQRMSQPLGHNGAGGIKSMKNSDETTWDRTQDLPAASFNQVWPP